MDPQSKKSKDWTLFGTAEDRAISTAKYKRGMGINPKAQIESNAEAAKRSRAMDNPTHRPYSSADSIGVAKILKAKNKAAGTVAAPSDLRRKASGTHTASYEKKPVSVAASSGVPKPKVRPERLVAETVRRAEGPRAAVNKTGIAGAKRSFSGNWTGAAPARAPKSLAEATRRGLSDEYMKRNRPKGNILEVVKTKVSIGMTPKKAAPVGSNKSKLAAQFRAKMQGRAK